MKNAILFLLLAGSFTAKSQTPTKPTSLKDLLYSGKLKLDSTAVIKKGDDLSSKIDTSTKKPEPVLAKPAPTTGDLEKGVASSPNTMTATDSVTDSPTTSAGAASSPATPVRSNTKIWKEYTDSLTNTLKTELLSSQKIKKETYFLIVDYEIGADGIVSILNVVSTPENAFLQEEVKKRMELTTPQLAPVLDSSGKPRKVKRKYNFNITKE